MQSALARVTGSIETPILSHNSCICLINTARYVLFPVAGVPAIAMQIVWPPRQPSGSAKWQTGQISTTGAFNAAAASDAYSSGPRYPCGRVTL